jgi:hypothetical protein
MNRVNFEGIGVMAKQVAAGREAQAQAFEDEWKAATEVIDHVVEQVRPALPAITAKQRSGLVGFVIKERDIPDETEVLYLLQDGRFALVTSAGDGVSSVEFLSTRLAIEKACRNRRDIESGVAAIVTRLQDALERHVTGDMSKRIAEAKAKTTKLRALLELLK